jgi:outer membrane lipoprotein LolB
VSASIVQFAKGGLLLSIFALFVAGCAVAPVPLTVEPDWSVLRQVESWQMKGRVSFRQGKEGWHGRISWKSDASTDRIKISGPIGQGALIIRLKEGIGEVVHADGRVEVVSDPSVLLERKLGFAVSIEALRWWVRGLPSTDSSFELLESDVGVISFIQQGWVISQWDFRGDKGRVQPYRLTVQREAKRLKFVVDRWVMGVSNE